jgi:hypothetical protein
MLIFRVYGLPPRGFRIKSIQCFAHFRARQRHSAETAMVPVSRNERSTHLRGRVSRLMAVFSGKDWREIVYFTRLNDITPAKPEWIEPITDDLHISLAH